MRHKIVDDRMWITIVTDFLNIYGWALLAGVVVIAVMIIFFQPISTEDNKCLWFGTVCVKSADIPNCWNSTGVYVAPELEAVVFIKNSSIEYAYWHNTTPIMRCGK